MRACAAAVVPGYPLEVHEVVTADGYLLRMERIPQPSSTDAVFMMHGEGPQRVPLAAGATDRGFMLHAAGVKHML